MQNASSKPEIDQKPEGPTPPKKQSTASKLIGPIVLIVVFGIIIFIVVKNLITG